MSPPPPLLFLSPSPTLSILASASPPLLPSSSSIHPLLMSSSPLLPFSSLLLLSVPAEIPYVLSSSYPLHLDLSTPSQTTTTHGGTDYALSVRLLPNPLISDVSSKLTAPSADESRSYFGRGVLHLRRSAKVNIVDCGLALLRADSLGLAQECL
ncbi:unnamed protein product [Brassica oleracea var. botrytis]|uniref:Uncharacterized protein n=2 Tax=Brassica TaxID=3705 RepID=A0A3P6BAV4_BRAOL|nr:unnamed protein product [Brassica napus]CDY31463.1 BnaC03g63610D [Brassica napus]VDC99455.1 unnamed protein product [Brassica oleracea]